MSYLVLEKKFVERVEEENEKTMEYWRTKVEAVSCSDGFNDGVVSKKPITEQEFKDIISVRSPSRDLIEGMNIEPPSNSRPMVECDFIDIIDESEFANGEEQFQGDELAYYIKDDVLCTSNGTVIEGENRFDYVGNMNLVRTFYDPNGRCYIRNTLQEEDYEINVYDDYYSKCVLGEGLSPAERARREKK